MLNCTCVHRRLTLEEAVIFYPPPQAGPPYVFARDCPEHGIEWEWIDEPAEAAR